MSYEILQLPHDPDSAQSYVEPYKSFRLLSLQLSPEAFLSTYEREKEFTDDIWLGRLTNPSATTFVAHEAGRLISTLTIISNLPHAPEELSPLGNPWIATNKDARLVPSNLLHSRINGLFTLPEARRKGLGQKLIERGIAFAADEARAAKKDFVVSIAVEADNKPAKKLYEGCGFVVIKEEAHMCRGTPQSVFLLKFTPSL
ncbi:hypothetical protein BP6252_00975 [Coleophoma cylindrospora]|uniref:N-acetyltransferase domain-containing protein n=1 Tax=Coleophoma cylindrospora TaxID=1849047 RepID=A0A3D8SRK8_9HELO|nr:hypothetical protein BP6252_00975 [Coleophoma cylindrospora]